MKSDNQYSICKKSNSSIHCNCRECYRIKLKRAINKNLNDFNLNVDYLIRTLQIERNKIYELSCYYFDESPSELIAKARIERSFDLLYANHPIATIAKMVGYNNVRTYRNNIYKYFYCSPTHLRECLQSVPDKKYIFEVFRTVLWGDVKF